MSEIRRVISSRACSTGGQEIRRAGGSSFFLFLLDERILI